MEKAGCEALFVGTGGVVGAYTGLADVGTATMTECVTIAGWIADSVVDPGDHRRRHRPRRHHGGAPPGPRDASTPGSPASASTTSRSRASARRRAPAIEVVPLEQAIARYRAAVDMKNELDPDFVVMAQCYARDAANGGLDDTIAAPEGLSRARPASIGCSSNRRIRSTRSRRRAPRSTARSRS